MAVAEPAPRTPNGAEVLLPLPAAGRVFRAGRRVRLGDVDPTGRLRLDALARYLQDVSSDDTDDSGLPDSQSWVVRRTVVEQHAAARLGERLELATFCSGYGSRWAERRVSVLGEEGARIEAVTVWVHVDPASGRPRTISPAFHALYDAAAGGRQVKARQVHEAVDPDGSGVTTIEWRPRAVDLDVLDHVNNAVAWALVEQVRDELLDDAPRLGTNGDVLAGPFRAEVEFRDAVGPATVHGAEPLRLSHVGEGSRRRLTLWSADGAIVHVTAVVQPLGDSTRP
jgi:acyl-ACP thioesterase